MSHGFCCSSEPLSEINKRLKAGKIPGPCQRIEKVVEHQGDSDTEFNWNFWNNPKNVGKRLSELEFRGRITTIQTSVQLKSVQIFSRVLVI